MHRAHRASKGFTLVELLVVIGIIAVLAAIIVPVFNIAKRKAVEAKTRGQMQQIVLALQEFHQRYKHYPPPPWYNGAENRYEGGLSALYPDFLDSQSVLICSEDPVTDLDPSTIPQGYSSYNGIPIAPQSGNWNLDPTKILYNYYGLSDGSAECGGIAAGFDVGAVNRGTRNPPTGWAGRWSQSVAPGTPSRKMPRLLNRYAPDNTIAFSCPYFAGDPSRDKEQAYIIVRLNGRAEKVSTNLDQAGLTKLWVVQE